MENGSELDSIMSAVQTPEVLLISLLDYVVKACLFVVPLNFLCVLEAGLPENV